MIRHEYTYNPLAISDNVPERDKLKPDYLIGNINYSISHLVVSKPDLLLAANYYHGVLDKSEFKYLEDNYGIGVACDLEFIPLVRKHIEALKGQLLSNPMKFGITCKDEKTLKSINESKKRSFLKAMADDIMENMKASNEWATKQMKGEQFSKMPDKITEEQVRQLQYKYSVEWQSEFEQCAQLVLNATLNNVGVDFRTKVSQMFENLLVYGSCYYKVDLEHIGEDPIIQVINPLDIFYNKNTNDTYINQCTRVVHRFYRTPEEIINMFPELTDEEIEYIMSYKVQSPGFDGYTREINEAVLGITNGDRSNRYYSHSTSGIIECYHVEWLANNPVTVEDYTDMVEDSDGNIIPNKIKRYRLDRYSGVKIGSKIYVKLGKDEVIRSQRQPYKCKLSYNGVSHTDNNGKPYSLILKTKTLQDKYNVYYFHRDNLVANAGVKGMYVDLSMLPSYMGDSPEDRLMQFMAISKQGFAPINTAQEGSSAMNTIFQGYDNSLDYNAIQGYNLLLQIIEDTVSSITGVPRQMLADIEQRDAVHNVQASMRQSMVINKPLFNLMDSMMRQVLTDMIDLSKVSFREGKYGSLLLGDYRSKIFSIEPQYFCFSDHDIHIVDSNQITEERQKIESLTMELVKAQALSASIAYDIITSSSLSEADTKARKGLRDSEQMQQQLQQASQQIQQLEEQIKQLTQIANKYNEQEAMINKAKVKEIDAKIANDKVVNELKAKELDIKKAVADNQIKVEALQIYDSKKSNDEPKNIV